MTKSALITSLAYRGYGVGKIDGKVVFVPFSAPGDELEVSITEEKKGFSFGKIEKIIKPSGLRQVPVCPVFTECGGCHWLHIKYDEQIRRKKEILEGFLRKALPGDFGGIEAFAAEKNIGYRSRAQFHVSNGKWGFFKPMSHDVADMESCPLLEDGVNKVFKLLRQTGLPSALHTIELTLDTIDGKCVAAFYVSEDNGFDWVATLRKIGDIKGFEVFLKKRGEREGKRRAKIAGSGDKNISYEVSGVEFSASGMSFTQVNMGQNRVLVEEVVKACYPAKEASIADLYCGAGNFTLPLGKAGAKVTGLDFSGESIEAARLNAVKNGVKAAFYRVEAGNFGRYLEKHGRDVVLLDPPREGGLKAVQSAARCGTKKIVYVSCSPPTLGRDIAYLLTKGYVLKGVKMTDMFPQTYHIEAIVTMERV